MRRADTTQGQSELTLPVDEYMKRFHIPLQSSALLVALALVIFSGSATAANPQFDWQPPASSIADAES